MAAPSQSADKGRRRRQPRHKAGPTNSLPTPNNASINETSYEYQSDTTRNSGEKATPKLVESTLARQIQRSGASTPPRQSNRSQRTNDADTPNDHKTSRKKAPHTIDTPPVGTPGSKKSRIQQTAGSSTPSKPVVEAYAGPTFHASPAPSALPVPKFFSKSAPSKDHDIGINARFQQDDGSASSSGGNSSSDDSPDSPSQQAFAKTSVGGSTVPTPALFNMLINADREEKARQRASQGSKLSQNPVAASLNSPPANAQRPGHHRTLTAGSVFPIDLDASSGRSTPATTSTDDQTRPENISSASLYGSGNKGNRETQRPYSSVESDNLKRILFSSPSQNIPVNGQSQHVHNTGTMPQSPPAWASSPTSRTFTSPYGTPSSASSTNGLAASSRPAPVSPYTQASPSPANRRTLPPTTPNNSSLRRQVNPGQLNLHHTPPHVSAYGGSQNQYAANSSPLSSPNQQRHQQLPNGDGGYGFNHPPYDSRHGYALSAKNHVPAGYQMTHPQSVRFNAQGALKASLGKGQAAGGMNMAGMEDELRRVLRIGDLRATSATAPPR